MPSTAHKWDFLDKGDVEIEVKFEGSVCGGLCGLNHGSVSLGC